MPLPLIDLCSTHAAELRARNPELRLPDTLVVATGSTLNADVVLTADAGWRRLEATISVL